MAPPYRTRGDLAPPQAPRDTGIVDDSIGQFADRYAFFRELVQNAIDAVNGPLGLEPSFVDVISIPATGQATRARYKTDIFESSGEDERADLGVETRTIDPPKDAPKPGGRVHLRRSLGAETLHYLFAGPPELDLVRGRCRDFGLPLSVQGEPLIEPDETSDVVRIDLPVEGAGFIALMPLDHPRAVHGSAIVDVAERGVVLASYSLAFSDIHAQGPFPVRLFINADRLKTNASRS